MLIRYLLISIIIASLLLGVSGYSNLSLAEPIKEIIPLNIGLKDENTQKIQLNNSDIKRALSVTSIILNNAATNEKENIEELSPKDPEIIEYFNKVSNVPFTADYNSHVPKTPSKFWNDNLGDCDDKSVAFADYLYEKGAKDVWIVTIDHQSKEYSHSCVMWHDKIYDPTATPPIYDVAKEKYYNFLQDQGFTLWVANTYSPDYVATKEKLAENRIYR
jgi:hypothetical protein